jgi:hypothetical protein
VTHYVIKEVFMPITTKELLVTKPPYLIVADCRSGKRKGLPKKERPSEVVGYSGNDPLKVGGGILQNNPCVYFKNGGWVLLSDFVKNHSIVSNAH